MGCRSFLGTIKFIEPRFIRGFFFALMRRFIYLVLFLGFGALIAWLAREPILRSVGNYLIVEDELKQAEVIFLLGGGSFDRGNEAAKLLKSGHANYVVCTGGQVPGTLKALGMKYKEAKVSKINLVKNNKVSTLKVKLIAEGTSTKEESELILSYCLEKNIKEAIVLSSKFHTRRVNDVFRPILEEEGINVILRGAPSSQYDEDYWWQYESGLIMVNNEYLKLLYYFWKY